MTSKKPPSAGFQKVKATLAVQAERFQTVISKWVTSVLHFWNKPRWGLTFFLWKNKFKILLPPAILLWIFIILVSLVNLGYSLDINRMEKLYLQQIRLNAPIKELQEQNRQQDLRIKKLEKRIKEIVLIRKQALGGTTGKVSGYPRGSCNYPSLIFPIKGGEIYQYWSFVHPALDIPAPYGTPIYASASGVVAYANWKNSYGIVVFLNIGGGLQLRFAHMSGTDVRVGDYIKKGAVIGRVGATGNVSSPTAYHVHFEEVCSGERINPLKYFR